LVKSTKKIEQKEAYISFSKLLKETHEALSRLLGPLRLTPKRPRIDSFKMTSSIDYVVKKIVTVNLKIIDETHSIITVKKKKTKTNETPHDLKT
jgi:hypothetical protein